MAAVLCAGTALAQSSVPAQNTSQEQSQAQPEAKAKLKIDEIVAQLPQRVTSKSGKPGDMVNFLLIGSRAQVQKALEAADWQPVDASVQDAINHALQDVLQHRAYSQMPMSQLYLFGRPQDMGYAQGIPLEVMQNRDHFRLWQAPWLTSGGQTVWVGAGTHDTGFERDDAGQMTHSIDPNVDNEREHIVDSLKQAGVVKDVLYFTPKDPLLKGLTATGDEFHSDGRVVVVELK
ncbi:MAG: LssY C-terminal domain-containing protein [Acidobacteriota bacterium]|nr:LssY C-terminal domain-containing protein [Acidobacteriota bacterium]